VTAARDADVVVGQVPIHHGQRWGSGYRRTKADIHRGYLDMASTPLFPFGHGLSYTSFDYGPLERDGDTVDVSGEARISLAVTNTGTGAGSRWCSSTRPTPPPA
jgi:beta-glucosidase